MPKGFDYDFKLKEADITSLGVALDNITNAAFGQAVQASLSNATKSMADDTKRRMKVRNRRSAGAGHLIDVVARRNIQRPKGAFTLAHTGVGLRQTFKGKYKPASRWHFEEFGTKQRKKALRPYFRPAFKSKRDEVFKTFLRNMERNLRKAERGKLKLGKRWMGVVPFDTEVDQI